MNDTELMLDVGQANQLKLAFRRNGWDNADINRLTEGNLLARLLPVIRGKAEVNYGDQIVDCDAEAWCPDGYTVKSHKPCGRIDLKTAKIILHLDDGQKNGKYLEGDKLQKRLESEPVLNSNLLKYYLDRPHLIPEEWKGKTVFFWGTILSVSDGRSCVLCLCWDGGRWGWGVFRLVYGWCGGFPAALLGE